MLRDESDQYDEPVEGLSLEDGRMFEQVLQLMHPEDQALLVPYYAYGFTAEDMSQAMNLSRYKIEKALRKSLKRTRARLQLPTSLPWINTIELG